MPDLAGFQRSVPEKVTAPGGIDIVQVQYRRAGTEGEATGRLEIRVFPTEDGAKLDYPKQVEGWKAPPEGVFGVKLQNVGSEPLTGMAEAAAFTSQATDASGRKIFTDVYRIGRVLVIQHVLDKDAAAAAPTRKALSEGVLAKVR